MKKLLIVFMLLLPNALIKPAAFVKTFLTGGAVGLFAGFFIASSAETLKNIRNNNPDAALSGMVALQARHLCGKLNEHVIYKHPYMVSTHKRAILYVSGSLVGFCAVVACYDASRKSHHTNNRGLAFA